MNNDELAKHAIFLANNAPPVSTQLAASWMPNAINILRQCAAALATPHTEAVRMSEAEIEALYPTVTLGNEKPVRLVWFTRNDVMKTARAVEQATAARLGVTLGDV